MIISKGDCEKIQKICKKEKVFFLDRPKKISGDHASIHEAIFHAFNILNQDYKYIILLQTTSPLRNLDLVSNRNKNFR